ncbi:hypothetical protein GCM10011374_05050 [Kocuria dechangensis]|uniref:Uncharacterized protein n=1 Tax=Kocuria dechangensis TaxID=1176249 RepID=A0A917GH89_9MICC|nr:hypothetical protein GCM10011374_05050 [Kocuria dechangensis]
MLKLITCSFSPPAGPISGAGPPQVRVAAEAGVAVTPTAAEAARAPRPASAPRREMEDGTEEERASGMAGLLGGGTYLRSLPAPGDARANEG